MTTYSFRPAALLPAQEWRLENDMLTGGARTVALADVTALSVNDTQIHGLKTRSLALQLGRHSVAVDVSLPAGARQDHAAWTALAADIAARLAQLNPSLRVTIGNHGWMRWTWFGLGIACLLLSLGIGAAAMLTGVSGDRMAAMAAPMLALFGIGLACLYRPAPWAPRLEMPICLLEPTLRATSPAAET